MRWPPPCGRPRAAIRCAPVAVVVPTNTAGVMARRALGRRGGAAAIDVLTLYRLAELLGAPVAARRGPQPGVDARSSTSPSSGSSTTRPGLYAGVKHHPSTVVALRDLYRELRVAGPAALTALARTARGSEPARVAAEVARLLARRVVRRGRPARPGRRPARAATCPIACGASSSTSPSACARSSTACSPPSASTATSTSCVGLTGDAGADAAVRRHRRGAHRPSVAGRPPPAPVGATGRARGRVDHRRRRRGAHRRARRRRRRPRRHPVRPHRRAVPVRPALRPPRRAPARRRRHPVERPAGHDRRRADGAAGARRAARARPARPAPHDADDAARRRAGPPAGRPRRADRPLGAHRARRRRRPRRRLGDPPARATPPTPADRGRAGTPAADADAGRRPAGVRHRAARRRSATPPAPGRGRRGSSWSKERLERWFGPRGLDRLDGAERPGVGADLRGCSTASHHLDAIGRPVTRAEFRATFVAELDITPGRHGKVGDGVHVSTLAGAAGLDVDVAVVLGAADGLLPPPPVVDPLLGDHERHARRPRGLRRARRRGAPPVPRRRHAPRRRPSSPCPAATCGPPRPATRRAGSTALAARRASRSSDASSTPTPTASPPTVFPVSAAEHRLRELWTSVRAGDDVRAAARRAPTTRCCAGRSPLRDARASDGFTVYDGDLSSRRPFTVAAGRSRRPASRRGPACPHAYFVQYVLGVRPIEEPEAIETLDARSTAARRSTPPSTALHRAVLDGALPAPGPDGWRPSTPPRCGGPASGVADELHAAGRTGRTAFWANDRAALLAALDRWLAFDARGWDGADRPPLRAGLRRRPSPSSWPSPTVGRSPSAGRSTASTSSPTARSSSPTTRRASRSGLDEALRPRTRRSAPPASSSRSTPPPPARCSAARTPPVRAEYTFFKPDFQPRPADVRRRRLEARRRRPRPRRRRHRGRRLPGACPSRRRTSTSSAAGSASPTASARPAGGPSGSASATTRRWPAGSPTSPIRR